jgi:hypothetical protein
MFGTGALLVGCGDASDDPNPVPNPNAIEFCAAQHAGTSDGDQVVICDELHAEAPFVHVPDPTDTKVIAGLQFDSFVTADGTSYPYPGSASGDDAEAERHAVALYELTLDDGVVKTFRPVVIFDEALFVEPFMGRTFEGAISRRDGEQFTDEATLPLRLEVLEEPAEMSSLGYSAKARIANLETDVTAADGSCMPALSSYGDEAPFAEGASVEVVAGRSPWMHGAADDEFVLDVFVDGASIGSMMAPTWYRGPIDLVRDTLEPSETYQGIGHGSPGAIPNFTLELVDEGGEPCTP